MDRTIQLARRMMVAAVACVWLFQSSTLLAAPAADTVETISVAVLAPEVVGELSDSERSKLAGVIDVRLTTSAAKQEGLTLVDREALDAILQEHAANASRPTALEASAVAAPLRPFWSAGVLVATKLDVASRVVAMEAISAQRGSHLAAFYLQLDQVDSDDVTGVIAARLPAFWADVRAAVSTGEGRPLVEVVAKVLPSLERMRWLTDEAAELARSRVANAQSLELLISRQPLTAKEERLLRLTGLAAPQPHDRGARLRASPDVVVAIEVSEKEGVGQAFKDTPVTVELSISVGSGDATRKTFTKPAGQWPDLLEDMKEWLDDELGRVASPDARPSDADDQRACELSRRGMAGIERWASLNRWAIEALPMTLRIQLHEVAKRAVHLDSTNEPATRMMLLTLMAEEEGADWGKRPAEYFRRHLVESQLYLDRFGDKNKKHHAEILSHISKIGVLHCWHLERAHGDRQVENELLVTPDTHIYEVMRITVRAEAEEAIRSLTDDRYGGGNLFQVFGQHLMNRLIPNVPEEDLKREYEFWKAFYEKNLATLPPELRYQRHGEGVVVPWELVDATFAARRRDPAAVRRQLQAVAKICPLSIEHIWGRPWAKRRRAQMLLEAAGDPEWETWIPIFGEREDVRVSVDDMTIFMDDVAPRGTRPWAGTTPLPLPGQSIHVPEAVREESFREGHRNSRSVVAVFQEGPWMWMTSLGGPPQNTVRHARLLVAPLAPDGSVPPELDVVSVPWPEQDRLPGQPTWSAAQSITMGEQSVVFMGTTQHGLLRLDLVNGTWNGRWITTKHGLPANRVHHMARVMNAGQPELLVIARERSVGSVQHDLSIVYSLGIDSDAVTLLYDGRPDTRHVSDPVAVLRDGRSVQLELAGSGAYPRLIDIKDIASMYDSPLRSGEGDVVPFTRPSRPGQSVRLWFPGWDGARHSLDAFDANSLELLEDAAPGSGVEDTAFPAVSSKVKWVLGSIMGRSGNRYGASRVDRWPSVGMPFSAGNGDVIWLGLNTGMAWDDSTVIVGYRPAPPSSGDWETNDAWIGPFTTPDQDRLLGLRPAEKPGTYLISTVNHMMLVDERELVEAATKAGATRSTKGWRKEYRDRLTKAGWQSLVPALVVDDRHDDALATLEAARKSLDSSANASTDRLASDFWTACVLAGMPGRRSDAIAAYDRIARGPQISAAAEAFARANQVELLHDAEQWATLVEVAEAMAKRFPQANERGLKGALGAYIAKAKERLTKRAEAPEAESSE